MLYTPEYLQSLGVDPTGLKFHGPAIPYDPDLRPFARDLRANGVKAEAYLWKILKDKKTGYRFLRQKPILHYIADFFCHELSLVVEIDGASHNASDAIEHDLRRDRDMKAIGLKVVRLWDHDVLKYPLASAARIFQEAGVEVPSCFSGLLDGSERLW